MKMLRCKKMNNIDDHDEHSIVESKKKWKKKLKRQEETINVSWKGASLWGSIMHFLGALLSPVLHNDGDIFERKTTKWGIEQQQQKMMIPSEYSYNAKN